MKINDLERDALRELVNVGLSRAAAQLSMLLNDQIHITVPEVQVVEPEQVAQVLKLDEEISVAAVWQKLTGYMEGTAMLMFPSEDSRVLVHSLVGQAMEGSGEVDLRAIEYEAMMEIGNIIITSGMVAIADMLGQEITMSLPDYMEAKLSEVMAQRSKANAGQQMQVIIIFTQLYAERRKIEGRMVLMMTVPSAKDLFARLDEMLDGSQA